MHTYLCWGLCGQNVPPHHKWIHQSRAPRGNGNGIAGAHKWRHQRSHSGPYTNGGPPTINRCRYINNHIWGRRAKEPLYLSIYIYPCTHLPVATCLELLHDLASLIVGMVHHGAKLAGIDQMILFLFGGGG